MTVKSRNTVKLIHLVKFPPTNQLDRDTKMVSIHMIQHILVSLFVALEYLEQEFKAR